MTPNTLAVLAAAACLGLAPGAVRAAADAATTNTTPAATAASPKKEGALNTIHQFTMKGIDGKDVALADYKGKVLVVVNVASKCGFTSQYDGLEKLYEKYKERGVVVLGFPANNFMGQEPGTDAEIAQFCSTKFGVSFPMFSKISVKGADIHPLYQYLTGKATAGEFAGDISWNFNKFVIGRDGRIVARFGSRTKPDAADLVAAIDKALAEKP
jgi:glutathione peroxidase